VDIASATNTVVNVTSSGASNKAQMMLAGSGQAGGGLILEGEGASMAGTYQGLAAADAALVGSYFASGLSIGPIDSVPMALGTNNTQRVLLDANGDSLTISNVTGLYGGSTDVTFDDLTADTTILGRTRCRYLTANICPDSANLSIANNNLAMGVADTTTVLFVNPEGAATKDTVATASATYWDNGITGPYKLLIFQTQTGDTVFFDDNNTTVLLGADRTLDHPADKLMVLLRRNGEIHEIAFANNQ
jgi:hypothetical protein